MKPERRSSHLLCPAHKAKLSETTCLAVGILICGEAEEVAFDYIYLKFYLSNLWRYLITLYYDKYFQFDPLLVFAIQHKKGLLNFLQGQRKIFIGKFIGKVLIEKLSTLKYWHSYFEPIILITKKQHNLLNWTSSILGNQESFLKNRLFICSLTHNDSLGIIPRIDSEGVKSLLAPCRRIQLCGNYTGIFQDWFIIIDILELEFQT